MLTLPASLFPASDLAAERQPGGISSLDLGPFVLHVVQQPFRWSLFYRGECLLAQRARTAGASLQFLDDSGWQALGGGLGVPEKRPGESVDLRRRARACLAMRVESGRLPGGAQVELAWYEWETGPVVAFSVTHSGAHAWRDDLISPPGTSYFPSSMPVPQLGRAPTLRGPSLVLASGGYGLFLEAKNGAASRIFEPDPDTLRLEVKGSRVRYLLIPGTPKQVLRARAELSKKFADGEPSAFSGAPASRAVNNWNDLREAVRSMSSSALSGSPLPTLVLGADATDSEFALRVVQVAALRPEPLGDLAPERCGDLYAHAHRFFKVHSTLGVLLRKYQGTSRDEGIGALRPIVVEYPRDPGAWKVNDQWLLGPHLLVAPILKAGATSREVYIPTGNWLALRSRNAVTGPTVVTVSAPVDSVPLFVKQSASEQFGEVAEVLRARE